MRETMRKLKFRAIDKYGQWAYFGIFSNYEDIVDKNTIGQFTGLLDKKGVEVYEGDILKDTHDYEDIYELVYEHNGFWMKGREANEYGSGFENNEWIEVIGNVYENPELLGGNYEKSN